MRKPTKSERLSVSLATFAALNHTEGGSEIINSLAAIHYGEAVRLSKSLKMKHEELADLYDKIVAEIFPKQPIAEAAPIVEFDL